MTSPVPHWFWKDEKGLWIAYDDVTSQAIEQASAMGHAEVLIGGGKYKVNMQGRKQFNLATHFSRDIRRGTWFWVEDQNSAYVPYAENIAVGLEAAFHAGQFDNYKIDVGNDRFVILRADGSTRQYRSAGPRNATGRAVLRGYKNQVVQNTTTVVQQTYQQPTAIIQQPTVIQQTYQPSAVIQQTTYPQQVLQQQVLQQQVIQQQQPTLFPSYQTEVQTTFQPVQDQSLYQQYAQQPDQNLTQSWPTGYAQQGQAQVYAQQPDQNLAQSWPTGYAQQLQQPQQQPQQQQQSPAQQAQVYVPQDQSHAQVPGYVAQQQQQPQQRQQQQQQSPGQGWPPGYVAQPQSSNYTPG